MPCFFSDSHVGQEYVRVFFSNLYINYLIPVVNN
jgi:hypothetical protein